MATALTSFYPGIRVHLPSIPTPLMLYYLREVVRDFCKETLIYQDECDFVDLVINQRSYPLVPPANTLVVRAMSAIIKHTASNGVITSATQADPVVVTSVEHGLSQAAKVRISGVVGMTEINDLTHTLGVVDDDTFELKDVDGTGYGAYVSGGVWNSVSAYTNLLPRSGGNLDVVKPDWRIPGSGVTNNFYCEDTETVNITWDPAEAVPDGLRVRAALQPTVDAVSAPDVVYNDWHAIIEAGAISRLMMLPNRAWTEPQMAAMFENMYIQGKREALGDRMAGNTHRPVGIQGSIGGYT